MYPLSPNSYGRDPFQETVDGIFGSSRDIFQFSELTQLPGGRSIPERNVVYRDDSATKSPLIQNNPQNYSDQPLLDPSQYGGGWENSDPRGGREKVRIRVALHDPFQDPPHTPGVSIPRSNALFLCVIQFLHG
jgi:hypothetical protein